MRILALSAAALGLVATLSCAASPAVDGARALERVKHQVEAGPRIPGTPGHRVIGDWIAAECARLGGRVENQRWVDSTFGRPLAMRNVIARFGPDRGRRIALLAHWDTRPFSDEDPDPAHRRDPVPGANDAGSGVAVLLEVAECMREKAPPIGVELVFVDGEDQGEATRPRDYCLGAMHYAASLAADPAQRPLAAFVFDMVGDRDLGIWVEGESSRRAANLVGVVLDAARATSARSFHDTVRYSLTDDHVPLLDAGLPAGDIIDFYYPAWHTHRDLPDQVSAASLAEVSRVACWIVYRSPLARSAGR
jgi:glutaminyl-peptide cyclotransferase